MQTFKDAAQARSLARLAFKAVQIGLLSDEIDFFATQERLEQVLSVSAIPWQEGLLLKLAVVPQDSLFNLNELDIKDGSPRDQVRWNLFLNILSQLDVPPEFPELPSAPLGESRLGDIYSALVDWIDKGDVSYQGASGGVGAEVEVYLSEEPEVDIKNGQLDRLSEIRLVRGVVDSRIPWEAWQARFAVLPKSKAGKLYPETLNVNLASREEIVDYLEQRGLDANLGSTDNPTQKAINKYADNAQDIAELLVPESPLESRTKYNKNSLEEKLGQLKGSIDSRTAPELFSFFSQHYRVQITTEFNEVEARLDALVNVPRNVLRIGTTAKVLHITLE